MSKTYRVETKNGYKDADHTVLYDTTVDGQPMLTGVPYMETFEAVRKVIADNDRYQEVCNGDQYCDVAGSVVRRSR